MPSSCPSPAGSAAARATQLFSSFDRRLHLSLGLLRHGHESERADPASRVLQGLPAAACNPPAKASCSMPFRRKNRARPDCLRHRGVARPGGRANPRRLHHRQLWLALDLLSQSAGGCLGLLSVLGHRSAIRRIYDEHGKRCRQNPVRFDTLGLCLLSHHDGLLGNLAEQRTGVGLVRRSFFRVQTLLILFVLCRLRPRLS